MTTRQTELLWREEKYRVMFYSQRHYNAIRQAMREQLPHEDIERLIREALACTPTSGSMQNACQHMWGYFKKFATAEEKLYFLQLQETRDFQQMLHFLKKLADDYEVTYLIESRLLSNG